MSVQSPPPPTPPAYQPPPQAQGPENAKASAKAARAYAKAQRPWFKKKRFIGLGALVILVAIIAATSSGGSKKTPSGSQPAATTPATTVAATTAAGTTAASSKQPVNTGGGSALPIQSGDWRLDTIRVKDDGLGDFGGVARVTYTGNDASGASNIFTLTVFKGTKDIAVLDGSANSVMPGKAVTVQFISSDKFVAGPYTFDFQKGF
jgi:hypothetical protein